MGGSRELRVVGQSEAECGCGVRTGCGRTEKGTTRLAGVGVRDGWSSTAA